MTKPIFDYPSDWEIFDLSPSVKDDIILDTSQGSDPSSKNPDSWNGTIPFLTPKDITRRFTPIYVSAAERYVTKKGASQSGGIQKANSVMLTIRAPVGSVPELGKSIERYLAEPNLRKTHGDGLRHRAKQHYSWDRQILRILDVYASLWNPE